MQLTLNTHYTLIAAVVVLMVGRLLVSRVSLLSHFNIPEPVAGGLVAALLVAVLHRVEGFSLTIDGALQDTFMLMFFASIGLNADFSRLRAGGMPLVVLTAAVSAFIVVQNLIGLGMASMLGLHPLTGLIAGSVTLTGGHGTAGGWGPMLEEMGVQGATAIGMACATFGLILGGLTGGPVAQRLINRHGCRTPGRASLEDSSGDIAFEQPRHTRLITADSALETITMFAIALAAAQLLTGILADLLAHTTIRVPTFVLALGSGIVVRNILSRIFNVEVFDRCVDVIGNVSLSLFLAMAMLSLKLWQLVDLAIPLLLILFVQTVVMVLYVSLVTFRFLGKDYDAAVIAAGHCGFGMGATPTAVANMQAVTQRYGISHKAFLIVPLVGAFFVDIINTLALSIFTALPFLH
ncbi:MAG: sodium/glutamate symporter [Azoarcus sp.]|jgi:ESS family glutamate:Na+ symporter|nr:sodium/glutamate symporter [Azoarcus sp.]